MTEPTLPPEFRATLRVVSGIALSLLVVAFALGACWQHHDASALQSKLAASRAQRDSIEHVRVALEQDSARIARLLAAQQAITAAAVARADSLLRTRAHLRASVRIADSAHLVLAGDTVATVPVQVTRLLAADDSTIAALDSANRGQRAELDVRDLERGNTAQLRAQDARTISNLTAENALLTKTRAPRFGFRAGLLTGAGGVLAVLAALTTVLR